MEGLLVLEASQDTSCRYDTPLDRALRALTCGGVERPLRCSNCRCSQAAASSPHGGEPSVRICVCSTALLLLQCSRDRQAGVCGAQVVQRNEEMSLACTNESVSTVNREKLLSCRGFCRQDLKTRQSKRLQRPLLSVSKPETK